MRIGRAIAANDRRSAVADACSVLRRPKRRRVVVFDVRDVLLEWDPRHPYRKLFDGDDVAMEHFLDNVCTGEWNGCRDAGRMFADAAAELLPVHADKADLIQASAALRRELAALRLF